MKKFISTTLAVALIGASAFALVSCNDENTNQPTCQCQPTPAPVTKIQYVQTLAKAAQSFYGAHKIGDKYNSSNLPDGSEKSAAQLNYEDTAYGELTVTANSELKMSDTSKETYLDGETEKTVELKMSYEMTTNTTVSMKKVGDYYYIRSNSTVNGTQSSDEFDEETKIVYTETSTTSGTAQYDLGAYVNGDTVTYYYAENETTTETTTSTDPDFVADEDNGVAQTTKAYAALTADEYYQAVLDVLESTSETVQSLAVNDIGELDASEGTIAIEEKYSKDGDNLVLSIDMFGIQNIFGDQGIGKVITQSGEGKFVLNETSFVSVEMNMVIAASEGEMGMKMAVNFDSAAAFTPLASLDGYELDEDLSFNEENFEVSFEL